ncbi:MAG: DUF642 domain-containing protein [Betaproteobacteria bacterium]
MDFGFSFNVIVNTNDSGQGSLRQFIANANALSNTGLNINGLTDTDVSVFMIPSPADPLGRSADPGYVDGRALIVLTSALPAITGANADGLLLDATTQTSNVGNTNAALLGSGGMVGTPATPLPQLDGPEVELRGNGTIGVGLDIDANLTQVSGFALTRFTTAAIRIGNGGLAQSTFLYRNVLGATALAFTDPGAGLRSTGAGIRVLDAFDVYIQETLIGFHGQSGVDASGTGSIVARLLTLESNEIRDNGLVNTASPGITNTAEVYKASLSCNLWSNLVIGNRGGGLTLSFPGTTSPTYSVVNGNTFSGNGTLATQPAVRIALSLYGRVANNVITASSGVGISLTAGRNVTISQNAIHGNGGIGIDLGGNGVTANDGLRTSGQPNELWDTPVIESATLSGSTLTVSGYVGSAAGKSTFGGGTVEVFIADATAGNFPAGQTYLGSLTAASNGTFSGQIANVSGVVSGTRLVATASEGNSGYRNTSEFGANFTVAVAALVSLSGTVFEDVNYGGGIGRNRATAVTSGGSGRPAARVELYDASGNFVRSTATDSAGSYAFSGLAAGDYTVRVVNSSVSSARSGYVGGTHLAVQTYRTSAAAGTATDVYDRVGGETPNLADAGNGSTTLAALTTGSTTAQSISAVTITTANLTDVDFGFNFATVVNTNDSGQGSLRQFIVNANALGGDASLAVSGRAAGMEHAIFMLANGTASPGLRAGLNYFSGGVATISLASSLPDLTSALVLDAQTQPGWTLVPIIEVNGNSVVETGLTLSASSITVRGLILNRLSARAMLISTGANGNTIQGNYLNVNAAGTAASSVAVAGIRVQGANNLIGGSTPSQRNVMVAANPCCTQGAAVDISNNTAVGNTVQGNYIGTNAAGTAALGGNAHGVSVQNAAANTTIGGSAAGEGNLISGNGMDGINLAVNSGTVIRGNKIGTNAAGTQAVANGYSGISFAGSTTPTVIGGANVADRNLISGNAVSGIAAGSDATIRGNYIGVAADGTTALPNQQSGIRLTSSNVAVGGTNAGEGNVIAKNGGAGVRVAFNNIGNSILGNAIHGNGGLGIDLAEDGVSVNDGAKTAGQPNLLMDYPVVTNASYDGATLRVRGYVGSAAGQTLFAGSRVEIFKSDLDASGHGEGRTYLGFVTADANGRFSGQIAAAGIAVGDKVTGTATDTANNTSEFGANVGVREYTPFRNGSFEQASIDPGAATTLPAGSTAITYWTVGGAINYVGTRWNASEGSRSIGLGSADPVGLISQSFDVDVGEEYIVFFDVSGSTACGPTRVNVQGQVTYGPGMTVGASGAALIGGSAEPTIYWTDTRRIVFTPEQDLVTLQFSSADGSACGPAIDNVRVRKHRPFANGGYESAQTDPGAGTMLAGGNTDIDRWTVGGGGINYLGGGGSRVAEGVRGIALNGASQGSLTQAFDTGTSFPRWYRARFAMSANPAGPASQSVQVSAHGQSQTFTTTHAGAVNWADQDLYFEVESDSTTLTLASQTAGVAGPLIDNVRVSSASPFRNGGFEEFRFPAAAVTNMGVDNPLVKKWITNAGSLQLVGAASFTPSQGNYSLHLNGPAGPGSITQTFTVETTGTARFDMLFDAAANPAGSGPQTLTATISQGATVLASLPVTLNPANALPGQSRWRTQVLSFTVGSGTTDVELTLTSNTAGSAGVLVDNFRFGVGGTYNTTGRFNAFEPGTPANAITGIIKTKVAGQPFMLDIAAIKAGGQGYSDFPMTPIKVELVDASDDSAPTDEITNCKASWTSIANVTSSFALVGTDGGRKALQFQLNEARRNVRVKVSYPASGTATHVGCSTDNFAVRPLAFAGVQAMDGDAASTGSARVLANANTDDGVVHRAGRPFALTGSAVDFGGNAVVGYNGTTSISYSCTAPAGCVVGTMSPAQLTAINGIVAGTLSYSEAGVLSLALEDTTYADVDATDGSTLEERAIRMAAPIVVGRFVPDRYVVAPSTPQLGAACGPGNLSFVGQPFTFATPPTTAVVPVNAAGQTLLNARPRFDASMVIVEVSASGAPLALQGTAGSVNVSTGTAPVVTLANSEFSFARGGTPVAPFAPAFSLRVRVNDTSETNGGGAITISGEGTTSFGFAAGHLVHYGRLNLRAAYGDARQDLYLPLDVQSFNGSGWLPLAAAAVCIGVDASHFAYRDARGSLATANLFNCASRVASVSPAGGRWILRLPRPPLSAGIAEGSMTVLANTLASASGQVCNAGSPVAATSTLASPWLAQPDGSHPAARAQWGRSRGDWVQLREVFD